MARLNVWDLEVVERPQETKEFTLDPGPPLVLTMRPPDGPELALAAEEARKLTQMFVTGLGEMGRADFPFPEVTPSAELFAQCAGMRVAQCPKEPGDAYDTIELCGLSKRQPRNWMAAYLWYRKLTTEWETDLKN